MRRGITAAVLAAAVTLPLGACSGNGRTQGVGSNQAEDAGSSQAEDAGSSQAGDTGSSQAGDIDSRRSRRENMTFNQMKEETKGTTVIFYGWGEDEKLNRRLDGELARVMKEKHDITVEYVPMGTDQVLSQLIEEIQTGKKGGGINMIWINGENFQSAKENNMPYGPFIDKSPNFNDYVDGESEGVTMDFAYSIEGYEAPYGKAQLVTMADLAVTPDVPENAGELKEFMGEYPGRVAYSVFPDFTGSAFMRNIIYEICGYEQFMDMAADKETVRAAVVPAMEYLGELNSYLWNQGAVFPGSSATTDSTFTDGKLVMSMTYGAHDVALNIEDGEYTDAMAALRFEKGTIDNTSSMAIAANSGNKTGAMVAINETISPEIQTSRYERLRVIPVLNNEKLSGEQKVAFDGVDLGRGTIPQGELLSKRLPEMLIQLVSIIEEIWVEEVAGK